MADENMEVDKKEPKYLVIPAKKSRKRKRAVVVGTKARAPLRKRPQLPPAQVTETNGVSYILSLMNNIMFTVHS